MLKSKTCCSCLENLYVDAAARPSRRHNIPDDLSSKDGYPRWPISAHSSLGLKNHPWSKPASTRPQVATMQTIHPLPANLLHDLRTPLNQIIGYSEMLVEQAREEGQASFEHDLGKVCAASQRLLGLINDNFESIAAPSPTPEPPTRLAPEHRVAESPETSKVANSPEGHLLVVDDNEGNRDVLSRRLARQGYSVASAVNGQNALDMLNEGSFDVVLLDIMMPELDGYEVLKRIKADDRLRHIPVIMISAFSELDSVARCIDMGAEDYLPKPFNPTILRARVGACFEKKRSRDREVQLFEELQKNYQRLQHLETLRDDLTNMIIHDLRTPLTSVIAAVQTFNVVGPVNEAQGEMMEIAVSAGETLLGMINSLLDVEKLEAGEMQLDYAPILLTELASAAIGQVAPLAKEKGLILIQEVSESLPWLEGDENKLRRTLVNLLGNAIKFTPSQGSIKLEIRNSEEEGFVQFSVRDTGEGIPAEAFGRIFEKFGQVSSRRGGRQMSTGLGLTFCKLAVEAHGGHIGVESTPGEGSNFHFTIPVAQAVQPPSPK